MKKIIKAIRKKWITIWLIAAVISLSAITAYAIYTRITIAKRVVSTQAGASSLFSSDYMTNGSLKTIEPITYNNQNATVLVHVYNYAYPKEAVYRSDSTEYELTATIGTIDENDAFHELTDDSKITALGELAYSITYNSTNETFSFGGSNGTSHTFRGCTIAGSGANSNLFTMVFDKNELGNNPNGYCIQIKAEPLNTDLPTLEGKVMVRYSKQASTGWAGEVEELNSSKITDYDGFNYYLTGNGKGKLTFRWNTKYVTINKDFLNNPQNTFYTKSTEIQSGEEVAVFTKITSAVTEASLKDGDIATLTIEVDSSTRNRYEIQFFKVNSEYSYSKADVESYLPNTQPNDWVADTTTASNS